MAARKKAVGHRWRYYETPRGSRPAKDFIDAQTDEDAAEIFGEMRVVRDLGLEAARHLRGEIYEVRISSATKQFRVLFASEGEKGRILLALDAWPKTTRRTPPAKIDLAESRLSSWRGRGKKAKKKATKRAKKTKKAKKRTKRK